MSTSPQGQSLPEDSTSLMPAAESVELSDAGNEASVQSPAKSASEKGEPIPSKIQTVQNRRISTASVEGSVSKSKQDLGILENLETFLSMAVAQGISDIHLRVDNRPILRKNGKMMTTKLPVLDEETMMAFIQKIVPAKALSSIRDRRDFDFGYNLKGLARFRVNLLYELNRPAIVMRVVSAKTPTLEDLGLPSVLKRFTELQKGLILVTGPTGSGKSTTLAAMLDNINNTMPKHIITIEDPVEYIYQNKNSVITQREIGVDTDSFPSGIKYALRQDPDVILIGEMRDRETITAALHAAETGHLVFSTLHTIDAVQTINRIINAYEPHERESVRLQIGDVLMGTISQRLVKHKHKPGRLAVAEIMNVTPAVRDYIKRNEMGEIYQMLKRAESDDMCNLNATLYKAVHNDLITPENALDTSDNPSEFNQMLRGAFHGTV